MNKIDYSLYLVTDEDIIGDRDFYKTIEEVIKVGVSIVQLREKKLSSRDFYEKAIKLKELCEKYKVPLIINDRVDIAIAADAHGIHIGQSDLPLSIVRRMVGEEKIVGVSVRTVEQAIAAQEGGADYIGVGAMYTTSTKTDTVSVSIEQLRRIKEAVSIPIVAIGGINKDNGKVLMDTGINGLAVVSAILGKENVGEATRGLVNIVK
ncbi:thiamine phosphate synthase [Oceanirhabdus sp. W0125-5]|uniref:thiamine phosphate synthase n=1 Tax=Oceanirhabdus sp. W0125-5 TaxID=2999116 RepID=UPI0022F2F6EC|nr:thiamine phosphate synthase [Oceanirhabdus sp. W0125-5]WBW99689.1 thiamine phosphate synthase [Oceanirhabdus sp. W0125-5]